MAQAKRATNNYVKNKDLVEAFIVYKTEKAAGRTSSKEYKKAYEKIGLAIWQIANGLGKKPNFSRYPFRDEMVSDAIENAVKYMDNFDPTYRGGSTLATTKNRPKSGQINPFAYFTQICYFAFIRRINNEKKILKMKARLIKESGIIDQMNSTMDGDDRQYINSFVESMKAIVDAFDKENDDDKTVEESIDDVEVTDSDIVKDLELIDSEDE